MLHLLLLLIVVPLGIVHFLPTIVAVLRDSRHIVAIFLLNLLLGWTVIGWIVALLWALTSQRRFAFAPAYARWTAPAWTGYRRF